MSSKKIITSLNIQNFFLEELQKIRQSNSLKIKDSSLFYISLILDEYSHSKVMYEFSSGMYKDKILGLNLLKSHNLSGKKRIRALKEIGDLGVILCGYFGEYMNKRVLDSSYYISICRQAYSLLYDATNNLVYKELLHDLDNVIIYLSIISNSQSIKQDNLLIFNKKNSA